MIIATFDYGFNVSVKDSTGTTVWSFSTSSGQYFTKNDLSAGNYTVEIGIPERTLSATVSADGMVGAIGVDTNFTLHTAIPG